MDSKLDKEFIPIMDNFCDELNGVFWGEITEAEEKIMNYSQDQSLRPLNISKLKTIKKRKKINQFEEQKLTKNDDDGNKSIGIGNNVSMQNISPKIHFYKLLPPTPKWKIQHLAASTPLPEPKKKCEKK